LINLPSNYLFGLCYQSKPTPFFGADVPAVASHSTCSISLYTTYNLFIIYSGLHTLVAVQSNCWYLVFISSTIHSHHILAYTGTTISHVMSQQTPLIHYGRRTSSLYSILPSLYLLITAPLFLPCFLSFPVCDRVVTKRGV